MRGIVPMFDSRWSHEKEVQTYGLWKLRALRAIGLGHGRFARPGDVFSIPGNHALMLVGSGSCEFVDEKLKDEEKIIAEMQRLGLDKPAAIDPEQFTVRRS